ncbi:hypothetical protein BO82DRAFT_412040 [Aspergillus uvarum CBS 121591]|uniref:Uncharacterized protein n=1 Tax=Aspergillus uvarum CBS 121591 TaxID=1448315 RepID=A0A319CFJ6_9EURO|nr:hypothetical protein BO82DRAFT_412040 [Aspergillus uvarum CBS 121591]PYH83099.1 hypothetical protein BO82DRAFT_412040 [Aspergillus uvarum CBS 121591]
MLVPTPDQLQRSERFRQAGMVWHLSELGKEQITVPVSFINFNITADNDAHIVQRRYFVAAREQLERRLLACITSGHEPPMPVLRIYQPPPLDSCSESSSGSKESDDDDDEEEEEEEEEGEGGYEACDEKSVEGSSIHGVDRDVDDGEDDGFDELSDFTVRMEFVVEETVHEPVEVLRELIKHVDRIVRVIDSTRQRVWPPHAAGLGLVSARIVKDGLPMQEEQEVDSEWPADEEEDYYSSRCESSGDEGEEEDAEWTEDDASFDEAEECCPSDSERLGDNNDPESADDSEDEENPIIYSDDDVVPLDVNEDAVQARLAWLLQGAMKSNPKLPM